MVVSVTTGLLCVSLSTVLKSITFGLPLNAAPVAIVLVIATVAVNGR
ncbi:MAG: hypothetical protein GIW94_08385 [Candidatus Eremiobacteraeota bacterium]|nr:hypothetical protein [Candidatus Eremiobacteraeota bacterium]